MAHDTADVPAANNFLFPVGSFLLRVALFLFSFSSFFFFACVFPFLCQDMVFLIDYLDCVERPGIVRSRTYHTCYVRSFARLRSAAGTDAPILLYLNLAQPQPSRKISSTGAYFFVSFYVPSHPEEKIQEQRRKKRGKIAGKNVSH